MRRTVWLIVLAFTSQPAFAESPTTREALPLSQAIDRHIAARWQANRITPAPASDDAEFLRRAYLDLVGRIPHYSETRDFLDDRSPTKRQALLDRLLESPSYVNHFTTVWRGWLLQQSSAQAQALGAQLDPWLRARVRANASYDEMARQLLTQPLPSGVATPGAPAGLAGPSAVAFYQANEAKAENLAASTARLFLGINLECAQCHDHPFAKWKRVQFWEYAAFFAGVAPANPRGGNFGPVQEAVERRELTIPGTDRLVQARYLDGGAPKGQVQVSARVALAEWLTRKDNPYFARAFVNRVWAHFFGVGLIDPVDEPSDENLPSHPALLDELARDFAAHSFDVKYLLRAITLSRTYQLTSRRTDPTQDEPQRFARMALKGLTAAQFYDNLVMATGFKENPLGATRGISPRAEFLAKFNNSADRRTEYQTSILQALALMNGKFVADQTSLDRSETLQAVVEYLYPNNAARIEALYLTTLSRKPRDEELKKFVQYVDGAKEPQKALSDVFWVLLNSSEFLLNH